MYTEEEVLYHAFKISQTRDDQLMHAGKSKKQITTDRMNRNQNTYGNAKANAYKSTYNQSQYAKKYADPNDPWTKDNSWKEKRKNKLMSPDERKLTTYGSAAGPQTLARQESILSGYSEADIADPKARDQAYLSLVNDELRKIPSHVDRAFSDLASNRNTKGGAITWGGNSKDSKLDTAEWNLLTSYVKKVEKNCDAQYNKLYGKNNNHGTIRTNRNTEFPYESKENIIAQAIIAKYGIPVNIVEAIYYG